MPAVAARTGRTRPPSAADWVWAAAFAAALLPLTVIELVRAMTLPGGIARLAATIGPVSYTHLTLPTN